MIENVIIKPLVKIPDERGCIYPMIRSDYENFPGFGEVFFSLIFQGSVQAWFLHKKLIQSFVVVLGMVKLVLFDPRENSKTKGEIQEIFLGDNRYSLVQIPSSIWYGFKGITTPHAMLATCTNIPFDKGEFDFKDPANGDIPYKWEIKHG